MFDEKKATAIASYFAEKTDGEVNDIDLMKLMYFSEIRALEVAGTFLTHDSFVNMANGPVMSDTYDAFKHKGDYPFWKEHFKALDGYTIRQVKKVIWKNFLADWEIQILEAVWAWLGKKSKDEKVQIAHDPELCPEWARPNGRVAGLPLEVLIEKHFKISNDIAVKRSNAIKNTQSLRRKLRLQK